MRMARIRRPLSSAFGASVVFHTGLLLALLFWAGLRPEELASKAPPIRTNLVFIEHSGESGGGGGNPAPAQPRAMQIPPHQRPSVAIVAMTLPAEPPPTIDVNVQTSQAVMLQGSGITIQAPPGPGGGGRGAGVGGGGDGPGVGPGEGGNRGGGPRRIGDGVSSPEPIFRAKPLYTNCAMQARISGHVTVEAVVLANGTIGDVKIIESLDAKCGLDLEAIKAARQWTFKPGFFEGKAVDVIVRIVLEFNLR